MRLTLNTIPSPRQNWPLHINSCGQRNPSAGSGELKENQIDLWSGYLDLPDVESTGLLHFLSAEENLRADSFRFDLHRKRFIAARGQLRKILSGYTEGDPRSIKFEVNPWGKPSLSSAPHQFNLSHSEDRFLLAISRMTVGVDLERVRGFGDMLGVARNVFSPIELQEWERLSEGDQIPIFYKIWTRKEALLKAIGCGITEHCPNVTVLFANGAPIVPQTISTSPWRVFDLQFEGQFAAAIATPSSSPDLNWCMLDNSVGH